MVASYTTLGGSLSVPRRARHMGGHVGPLESRAMKGRVRALVDKTCLVRLLNMAARIKNGTFVKLKV